MAQRGEPRLLRSDNGSNFVGAERELRKEIEDWNKERIQEAMSQRGIRWLFNPPSNVAHGRGLGASDQISSTNPVYDNDRASTYK